MSGTLDSDFFSDMPTDDSFLDKIMNSDEVEGESSDSEEETTEKTDDDFFVEEKKPDNGVDDFFAESETSDNAIDDFFSDSSDNIAEEKQTGVAGLDDDPFGASLFGESAETSYGTAGIDDNPFGDSLFGSQDAEEEAGLDDGNPFADLIDSKSSENDSKEEPADDENPFW